MRWWPVGRIQALKEGDHPISRKGPILFSGGPPADLGRSDERCYLGRPQEEVAMVKERISVRMQAQIRFMSEQGYSIRAIARIFKLSRKSVRKYLTVPATVFEQARPGSGLSCALFINYLSNFLVSREVSIRFIVRAEAAHH
jgi:hypothetical protein